MIGAALPALPRALRASRPAARRGVRRDHVRLLVVERAAGAIRHRRFDRLPELLGPGDLLVVNTSRVLPAAVAAVRASGEPVQLRPCVRDGGRWDALAVEVAPPHANVPLEPGETLHVGPPHEIRTPSPRFRGDPGGEAALRVRGRRPDIPLLWRLE